MVEVSRSRFGGRCCRWCAFYDVYHFPLRTEGSEFGIIDRNPTQPEVCNSSGWWRCNGVGQVARFLTHLETLNTKQASFQYCSVSEYYWLLLTELPASWCHEALRLLPWTWQWSLFSSFNDLTSHQSPSQESLVDVVDWEIHSMNVCLTNPEELRDTIMSTWRTSWDLKGTSPRPIHGKKNPCCFYSKGETSYAVLTWSTCFMSWSTGNEFCASGCWNDIWALDIEKRVCGKTLTRHWHWRTEEQTERFDLLLHLVLLHFIAVHFIRRPIFRLRHSGYANHPQV